MTRARQFQLLIALSLLCWLPIVALVAWRLS